MKSEPGASEAHLRKFQGLMRELFQFDCADLDFGIYRIMNHKRDAIEKFVSEELPARIANDLGHGALDRAARVTEGLEENRQKVVTALGSAALDADGELISAYTDTPVGREYLDAKAAAEHQRSRQAVESDTYNHLYTFFSRYYQDGDFISKRRYSRNQRYAIPYNGEEVHLHWANSDQYYVKTAEHFHNYDWKAPNGVSVRFRLETASVEQNNVKGDTRFFLPLDKKVDWDDVVRSVTISFEYRPLTAPEARRYGARNQQDNIIKAVVIEIQRRLTAAPDASAALTSGRRRHENGELVSHLEHHLHQYTRRNDSDFFIHKDLRGFLSRELDFYLKNEVLNLDNLEAAGEAAAEGWFQQIRLIKSVGSDIIDFLAQIEGFQKMLWEKRKFVVDAQYCVTLDNVDAGFYEEIVANDTQWAEWRELLGIDDADRSAAFIASQPTLPLDTCHFDAKFTDRLLASFTDLDGMTDGLLVCSENWQGLRLMDEKYQERVKAIYIDPPYNTDASAIVYKNGYKDSSWLSLMENRLQASYPILQEDGILCAAIDDVEYPNFQKLLSRAFFGGSSLGTAVVRSNPAGRSTPTGFSSSHEYALFFSKRPSATVGRLPRTEAQNKRYKSEDEIGVYEWVNFRKHGGLNAYRIARRKLFYPIYVAKSGRIRLPAVSWVESTGEYQIEDHPQKEETVVWPISDRGEEKTWKWGKETMKGNLSEFSARPNGVGEINIYMKSRMKGDGVLPSTWWDKKKYSASEHGTRALIDLFGDALGFSFPKAAGLVEDCIRASGCESQSMVLDYFAGSGTTGHAVINLNREDGGQRMFILVEMGEYFDTVLLPRIKKVTFTPEWKNGKPERAATPKEAQRSPRILKYIRLESYEDALDGIGFDEEAGRLNLEERIDGYLLKYMLKWETKQSETLLNAAKLTRPFDYRLRAHASGVTRERTADVPETFAYLLGLNVRTRRAYNDNGRRYLVYRGETRDAPGRSVAVVWRETDGWTQDDFARDRQFVAERELAEGAETVYINGDSVIPGAKPVEPLFKARMFAGVTG